MATRAFAKAVCGIGVCAAVAFSVVYAMNSTAQSASTPSEAAPIYGVTIPPDYRDWRLISVGHLTGDSLDMSGGMMEGSLRQLRAQLGNDIALKAFQDGTRPFPDRAMIAAIHWAEEPSDGNNKVLASGFPKAGLQSSVAGVPVNVQFMVKDSKKYASSGGWGFADFKNGKPGSEALHKTCFPCHQPAADRDYVFARYAPTP
jgi:hypothetical protein